MADHPFRVEHRAYDGVIFDLDGVVTRTARLHARAWKRMFDAFLQAYGRKHPDAHTRAFDIDTDYKRYVDGKPRYDGVAAFLQSRGIDLPTGDENDPDSAWTVHGLGNRKNTVFLDLLAREGPQVYEPAVRFIRALRTAGFALALVTSSRNGRRILENAAIENLFDVVLDGNDAAQLGLRGKPDPDLFRAAAAHLATEPARTLVFEDAQAGVQAARRGGFTSVGVARNRDGEALKSAGADVVVTDLSCMQAGDPPAPPLVSPDEACGFIRSRAEGRDLALFLDYDGTLTPIVDNPDAALLSDDVRRGLESLSRLCTVAVISGRDLQDVSALVNVSEIYYAGSHGFELAGPGGQPRHERGEQFAAALKRAQTLLENRLSRFAGCTVERKRYAIAVHYRHADPAQVPKIENLVDRTLDEVGELRKSPGKKVFDIRPAIDWDKGRAVRWLMDALSLSAAATLAVYIGDDTTDEDAFAALANDGLGILVGEEPRPSYAGLRVQDTEQVYHLLCQLVSLFNGHAS